MTGNPGNEMVVKQGSVLISYLRAIALLLSCGFTLLNFCCPASAETPAEPPNPVAKIQVANGLLSVELSDADLGTVIKEISDKAKFKAEISSDAAYKKISTVFKNIDVEKGLRRLLTIAKEKDFTISYDPSGAISMLEVYGEGSKQIMNSSPQKRQQQMQTPVRQPVQQPVQQPAAQPFQPQPRPRIVPPKPVPPPAVQPAPSAPPAPMPVIPVTPAPPENNTE